MPTRISSTQMADSSLLGIMNSYERFDNAQRTVNTGKQIQVPSDNPSGTADSLGFQEKISELDQFSKNMNQALGYMSTSESSLNSVSTLLRQARTIAVQGASDNTSSEARQALASQLDNIIQQLGNIGNATYGSRYVFAGQLSQTPPFSGAGSGYVYTGGTTAQGNDKIVLDIGRGESVQVNATGDKVLSPLIQDQTTPTFVRSILGKLRDDIASGSSNVITNNDLGQLDTQINNVLAVRADMGAKIQRLNLTISRNDQTKVNFTAFISKLEDADIPKSVIELQSAQTAYQAALAATSRSFQNSLLDYLR